MPFGEFYERVKPVVSRDAHGQITKFNLPALARHMGRDDLAPLLEPYAPPRGLPQLIRDLRLHEQRHASQANTTTSSLPATTPKLYEHLSPFLIRYGRSISSVDLPALFLKRNDSPLTRAFRHYSGGHIPRLLVERLHRHERSQVAQPRPSLSALDQLTLRLDSLGLVSRADGFITRVPTVDEVMVSGDAHLRNTIKPHDLLWLRAYHGIRRGHGQFSPDQAARVRFARRRYAELHGLWPVARVAQALRRTGLITKTPETTRGLPTLEALASAGFDSLARQVRFAPKANLLAAVRKLRSERQAPIRRVRIAEVARRLDSAGHVLRDDETRLPIRVTSTKDLWVRDPALAQLVAGREDELLKHLSRTARAKDAPARRKPKR